MGKTLSLSIVQHRSHSSHFQTEHLFVSEHSKSDKLRLHLHDNDVANNAKVFPLLSARHFQNDLLLHIHKNGQKHCITYARLVFGAVLVGLRRVGSGVLLISIYFAMCVKRCVSTFG